MSDDTDSNVLHLPTRGSHSGGMPDAPDGGDLFYSEPSDSGAGGGVPPESPTETTMELPPVRGPISPETVLRETGMPAPPESDDGEYEEGEYVQPRSLADRLGDWLEYRLELARDRHAGEAPFREAEIARKAALLEARTAQEVAAMEQNGKLHAAMMKAKADKTAARSKADADRSRSSSSGMGTDKGRSKAGGGGSSRGGGGSSGGSGRSSGGGNSPKGGGKGSDRSAGGRSGASKGTEPSGGSKGRQNGSGGTGGGKAGTGKGSSSGAGSGKGGSKGDGGKTQNSPASSPRAERARGRQERAAARQAARQQRRSANQAANIADRSKDRDRDRANQQAAREERRAAKAERRAARKAKREGAKADDGRTTLGVAVAEGAQQRWDERRATAKKDKAATDGKAKESTGDKDSETTTRKVPKHGPEPSSDGPDGTSATKQQEDGKKSGEKPAGSSSAKDQTGTGTDDGTKADNVKAPPGAHDSPDDSGNGRSFKERFEDFFAKEDEDTTPPGAEEPPGRATPEDLGVTVDSPGRPSRPPKAEPAEEDIPDAVIIEDRADPFGAYVSRPAGLPPAPEPHTQRLGTTRPTAQEDPVASEVRKTTSGQTGMAAKHRTDITFGEYLVEMVNIAIAAGLDKDRAQELAVALGKVADALRDMAADLVGDHNIATEVVDEVTDLADAADSMKQLAERCATECEIASEAARIAAMSVGRTYGEDIRAMDDAGLTHASAAAHHD